VGNTTPRHWIYGKEGEVIQPIVHSFTIVC
jgi:hypothetical protein